MSERRDEMQRLAEEGLSLSAIGGRYGISKQRVSQILRPEHQRRANNKYVKARYHADMAYRAKRQAAVRLSISRRREREKV